MSETVAPVEGSGLNDGKIKKGRNRDRLPTLNSKGHSPIYEVASKKVPQKRREGAETHICSLFFQEVCLTNTCLYTSEWASMFQLTRFRRAVRFLPFNEWFEPLHIPGFSFADFHNRQISSAAVWSSLLPSTPPAQASCWPSSARDI